MIKAEQLKIGLRQKMVMLPEKFIKDFAERTRKNLDAIDALLTIKADVYEITQLVNSCLGLLVFPRQRYIDKIPETKLSDLAAQGWPIPIIEQGKQIAHLKDMIENMRHAVAHCNLDFIGNDRNEINGLHMWNSKTQWKVRWNIEDLRKFVIKFSDMLIQGKYCSECNGCS